VRVLTNNPDKTAALEAHGVAVAGRVPLLAPADEHNVRYLTAKRDRLGHDLPQLDPADPAPGRHRGGGTPRLGVAGR